jgi:hypothetical protein
MNDWREHQALVVRGTGDSRTKRPETTYATMRLGEVFTMPPQNKVKHRAAAMIPSSYAGHDGRIHSAQRERGQYVALIADIDSGAKTLEEVRTMVIAFTGSEVAWRIFSTASATADAPRWRVIIPLQQPLAPDDWSAACEALLAFAHQRAFEMDASQNRWAQLAFLPNVPPDKRTPDGQPLFYQSDAFTDGRGLAATDPALAKRGDKNSPPLPPTGKQAAGNPQDLARTLKRTAGHLASGPIQRFNATHSIEDLLKKYGYTPSPNGQHWRSRYQTSKGFGTRFWPEGYWVSHSASDAARGLGRESRRRARTGDAFDLFVHFEHAGDFESAISAAKMHDAAALTKEAEALVTTAESGDLGAPFEPPAVSMLNALQTADQASFIRVRNRLKAAKVSVGKLDQALKRAAGEGAPEADRSVADELIALARARCRFVHDEQREPFAVLEAGGTRQVYGVHSSSFSDFLSHAYYTEHDRAPNDAALKVALATLRGQAQFDGETVKVFIRTAKTEAGYWLDLCNDAWQCVRITPTGWTVMTGNDTPLFTRTTSMRPLPIPEQGGSLDALWPLVNIPEPDRLMVLAWLLECMRPDTPHVVLELIGEHGSAKSGTQRALRRLIDPNEADLRAAPKSVEDVWIAARNAHMVSLENLSHLLPQYQDALCVLATGGGFSARTLYTNAEETIINLRKPIVLNGISVIVTAQDLLDRCLHIELPTIRSRELEIDIEAGFQRVQPQLLAALLDLFVKVLATLPEVTIAPEDRPRMADFALLGEAVIRVCGHAEGAFLHRYATMRRDSILATIDASPVGSALLAFLEDNPAGYAGPLSELLWKLGPHRQIAEAWPRSAKGLGDALRRLAPALRIIGYHCEAQPKTGGVIRWHIFRRPDPANPCPASPECPAETASVPPRGTWFGAALARAGLPGH